MEAKREAEFMVSKWALGLLEGHPYLVDEFHLAALSTAGAFRLCAHVTQVAGRGSDAGSDGAPVSMQGLPLVE